MATVRILIVEDEAIVALALKRKIEAWGYAATSVERNGAAAIRSFDRDAPDLALLDIFLADSLDGIDVARHIRSKGETPYAFLTASVDPATQARALAERPLAIIQKPYADSALKSLIVGVVDPR
ncbi:MAG: response regulator [Spirochaetaceae bacterium]|nr:response regulator [Spirochaetaceae bacterium]